MSRRKVFAALLIVVGILFFAIPIVYHYTGMRETEKLTKEFEQNLEEVQEDETEMEETGEEETEAAISEEDAATLAKAEVIGLIESEALDIKYAVLEGAGSYELSCGIGHIPDTAGIGETGNCVLAGHNGSRHGTYFTNLKTLKEGDVIKLTDKKGSRYFYEVESMEVVDPYDNSVKDQGEGKVLTLLTCENSGTMRLTVRCSLKEAVE